MREFLIFFAGYAALVVFGIALYLDRVHRAAFWVGWVSLAGTTAWTLGTLAYVVLVDSRRRWPGIPVLRRLARVVTLYRD